MRTSMAALLVAPLASLVLLSGAARAADAVPCEDMLKDLRAKLEKARLGDADKAKVEELEAKGIERCNADDDKRADDFFAQALQILGQ